MRLTVLDWSLVHFPIVHDPIASESIGGNGVGQATELWCNGNPSKFLQGHNVFGSDNVISLLYDVFCILVEQRNLQPTEEEINRIKTGDYPIKMFDVNYSFSLPSRADVLAFIRALEFKAKTRHGRPSTRGGTLYFGKNSHRWAIKLYCKAEEIQTKRGKLPFELLGQGIETWVEDKLRIELRLLRKELEELNIKKVKDLENNVLSKLFNEYLRKIDMNEQIKLTEEVMMKMPNKLRSTYTLWSEGHDLRNMISKSTYYLHRRDLKEYGINIDLRPETTKKSNVVPLVRILEAVPAEIPHWAYEKGFVHHSAAM